MSILLRPAAVGDVEAGRDYYEEAQHGLGASFREDLNAILGRLEISPRSGWPVLDVDGVRRAGLRRCPFGVFYLVRDDDIVVLRMPHGARSPATWSTADP